MRTAARWSGRFEVFGGAGGACTLLSRASIRPSRGPAAAAERRAVPGFQPVSVAGCGRVVRLGGLAVSISVTSASMVRWPAVAAIDTR